MIEKISPSKMRKVIARVTTEAFKSIPHYSIAISVRIGSALKILKDLPYEAKLTDLIIFKTARLLRKYKYLNGYWEDEYINIYDEINIGYAVAVDDGMLVPIIKNADTLSLSEIHRIRRDLVNKTLNHKLLPDEYKGGTFTISNLGIFPIDSFTAIIYPKQSGILTLGRAFTENNQGFIKLTLTSDHRVVDGYYAAKFLSDLKSEIEQFGVDMEC